MTVGKVKTQFNTENAKKHGFLVAAMHFVFTGKIIITKWPPWVVGSSLSWYNIICP